MLCAILVHLCIALFKLKVDKNYVDNQKPKTS